LISISALAFALSFLRAVFSTCLATTGGGTTSSTLPPSGEEI